MKQCYFLFEKNINYISTADQKRQLRLKEIGLFHKTHNLLADDWCDLCGICSGWLRVV